MYHGMCIAYRETGQNEAAMKYANRSVALREVVRDRASLARIENDLGLLMMAKGDHQEAHRHLDRALDLTPDAEPEAGRAAMILSLSELSLQEGNVDAAAELAEQGLRLAEKAQEPVAAALPSRSEEHTSELQSPDHLVCRLLLEKKKKNKLFSRGTVSTFRS